VDDAWRIVSENVFPETAVPVGSVLTLPATGSEWNLSFVISRRSIRAKFGVDSELVFPKFSLLDPLYTMTLPVRQLRNGVFDAIVHCIDQFLTGQEVPIMDGYWMNTIRELVDIGPDVVEPTSSIELRERLIVAATFACNGVFRLGKEVCWGIHTIGHQLTVKYGIDHGATLSIAAPDFLESQIELRKSLLAKSAEAVFDIREGTVDQKARAFIAELRKFIVKIGLPTKVSEWGYEPLVVAPGDVEDLVQLVVSSRRNQPFGWRKTITEDTVRYVATRVVC
jgi:alcohol dehydrogenase YqhD (iron-dependent ADH family)